MSGSRDSHGSSLRTALLVALIGAIATIGAAFLTDQDITINNLINLISPFGNDHTPTPTGSRRNHDTPTPTGSGPIVGPPTNTPPPVPTDTPEPEDQTCVASGNAVTTQQFAVVTADSVNVRSGPGSDCPVHGNLEQGRKVQVLSEPLADDAGVQWTNVRIVDTGEEGWIRSDLLGAAPEDTPSDPRPDLAVSAIAVLPEEPVQGVAFTYNVYATNQGTAYSGDFTLQVLMIDVARNSTYPDVPRTHTGLYPGENYSVYFVDNAFANCAGPHEIRAEFSVPDEDADPSNNVLVQAFTVQPNAHVPACD